MNDPLDPKSRGTIRLPEPLDLAALDHDLATLTMESQRHKVLQALSLLREAMEIMQEARWSLPFSSTEMNPRARMEKLIARVKLGEG